MISFLQISRIFNALLLNALIFRPPLSWGASKNFSFLIPRSWFVLLKSSLINYTVHFFSFTVPICSYTVTSKKSSQGYLGEKKKPRGAAEDKEMARSEVSALSWSTLSSSLSLINIFHSSVASFVPGCVRVLVCSRHPCRHFSYSLSSPALLPIMQNNWDNAFSTPAPTHHDFQHLSSSPWP